MLPSSAENVYTDSGELTLKSGFAYGEIDFQSTKRGIIKK
jgi:hypothetical protein